MNPEKLKQLQAQVANVSYFKAVNSINCTYCPAKKGGGAGVISNDWPCLPTESPMFFSCILKVLAL
jgi:hypothetical protein